MVGLDGVRNTGQGLTRLRLAVVTLALVLAGCETTPPGTQVDACTQSSLFGANVAQVQDFWLDVLGWPADRFETQCRSKPDSARLLPYQRLRLALASAAPNNPLRSLDQARAWAADLGPNPAPEMQTTARLVLRLTEETQAREQRLAQLEERLRIEQERAEAESRRAAEAQRRAAQSEERFRESERKLAESHTRLADAARRLDALKSVEDAMNERAARRRGRPGEATPAPVIPPR
jgi:hypothetical protein